MFIMFMVVLNKHTINMVELCQPRILHIAIMLRARVFVHWYIVYSKLFTNISVQIAIAHTLYFISLCQLHFELHTCACVLNSTCVSLLVAQQMVYTIS